MNHVFRNISLCVLLWSITSLVKAQDIIAGIGDASSIIAKKSDKKSLQYEDFSRAKNIEKPMPQCDTVLNFVVSQITPSSIKLQWQHTGHYSKTKYKLKWTKSSNFTNIDAANLSSITLNAQCGSDCPESYTIMGLEADVLYKVFLIAECDFSLPNSSYSNFRPNADYQLREVKTLPKCDLSGIIFNTAPEFNQVTLSASGTNIGTINTGKKVEFVLKEQNNTTVIQNQELLLPTAIGSFNKTVLFDNLLTCKPYIIQTRAQCVNPTKPNELFNGDWEQIPAQTKCCEGINWAASPNANYNSIEVKWYRGLNATNQVYELTIFDELFNHQTYYVAATPANIALQNATESYTFTGLQANHKYIVNIKPICNCIAGGGIEPDCTNSIFGQSIECTATTTDPCTSAKKMTILAVQANQFTVNVDVYATPLARKYTINIYQVTSNPILVTTKDLIALPNSSATLSVDITGLIGGQQYRVELANSCYFGVYDPNNVNLSNWLAKPSSVSPQVISTPNVSCPAVQNLATQTITSHKAVIQWAVNGVGDRQYQVQLRKGNIIERDTIITGNSNSISYAYYGLTPNTSYSIKVVALCCQSNVTPCANWLSGEDANVSFKTDYVTPSICNDNPTLFTLTSESDKIKIEWASTTANPEPLSASGRRFVVEFGGNPMQSKLIYDASDATLKNLTAATVYTVKIREIFDGSYNDFTEACPLKTLSISTKNPPTQCDNSFAPTFECAGERYMVFKIAQSADNNDYNIRIHYREVTSEIDPVTEDCDLVAAVTPKSTANVTAPFMDKLFSKEPYYYLTDLNPCAAYEVFFETFRLNSQGEQELCNSIALPQWYLTKRSSTVATTDADGDGFPDQCDPINNPKPKPDKVVSSQLKDLICGTPPPSANLTGLPPHTTGANGEVWTINGFPFEVKDITINGGNSYSGTGMMSLPFGMAKKLKVQFSNITVVKGPINGDYFVSSGNVTGFQEDVPNLTKIIEDINSKSLDGDKRFCQDHGYESGSNVNSNTSNIWDERGFCKDGKYCKVPPYTGFVNGTPIDNLRDPRGFNKAGEHENGTKYDDCGCDAYGNPEPGKTCNKDCKAPYYWLAPKPTPTKAGLNYFSENVKSISDLEAMVRVILSAKLKEREDALLISNQKCATIVQKMDANRATLGYTDRSLIYGPNDAWVNTGMHKLFSKVPVKFTSMDRKQGQDDLEINHNLLYAEDLTRLKLTYEKEVITDMMVADYLKNMVATLEREIKGLEQSAINEIKKDVDNPKLWLTAQIDKQIAYEYSYKGKSGSIEKEEKNNNLASILRQNTAFASDGDEPIKALLTQTQTAEAIEQQLQMEYEQGWSTVGGVDRAYLLEEINRDRLLNEFLVGTGDDAVGTPYPVLTPQAGRKQAVYLDQLLFTATTASANFYAIVETGQNKQIAFKAEGIQFHSGGLDPNTKIYLGLASDIVVPMSNAIRFTLKGSGAGSKSQPNVGTYVAFSCDGFEGIQIDTDIEICDKYVIPLTADKLEHDLTKGKYVKINTKAFFSSFNDIQFTINEITPFALTKYQGFKFKFTGPIVIDFSDLRTDPSVVFPTNYLVEDTKLWRGLYMKKLEVFLPPKLFKGTDSSQPKSAGAEDFIFDGGGVTGRFFAKNLLPLKEGSAGTWQFSISDLEIQFRSNHPVGGGFGGELHIPLFKEGQNLKYNARVLPDNKYEFTLKPKPDEIFDVDLWLATVHLTDNSIIRLAYEDEEFHASAILDGTVSMNNDTEGDGKSKMDIKGIGFQGLSLDSSKKPYVKNVGIWDVPDINPTVGGFTFFLDKISLRKEEETENGVQVEKVFLHFNVGFELVSDKGKGFNIGAKGDFDLIGTVKLTPQNKQVWEYDRLRMNELEVHTKTKGFSLDGKIIFFGPNSKFQSAKYGKGFFGYLSVTFEGMSIDKNAETGKKEKDAYGITALAIFGRVDVNGTENKYFLVDLMVMLGKGVNIGGGVKLVAAGGGVSWHMARQPLAAGQFAFSNKDVSEIKLGESLSGFTYLPDDQSGLSIRLMVALAGPNENAFSANAQFEISFGIGGGIKSIRFDGLARFLQEPQIGLPGKKPASFTGIIADLEMEYEVEKRIFYANLEVYANIVGGLVKGCAGGCKEPYRVGAAEIYISPNDWYINIGRTTSAPNEFISIGVGVGSANLILSSYFNLGTKVPPLPQLPDKALPLLGAGYKRIDEGLRSSGKGIAFGARIEMEIHHDGFIVDVDAAAGFGFDLMMAHYGDTKCVDKNGSLNKIGINGWYATGQAYLYATAKVIVAGKPLCDVGGVAVAQFSGPNPLYLTGYLKATVNGKSREFVIDKGERCNVASTSSTTTIQPIKVISSITPSDKNVDVNRHSKPEIIFEVPVNKEFSYKDLSGNEIVMRTGEPIIEVTENGSSLDFDKFWNAEKTRVTLRMKRVLPANVLVKIHVKVGVTKNGIALPDDEQNVEFTTDEAWKVIPKENVFSSYPLDGMVNYYRNEEKSNKGWIALKDDQTELLSSSDELEPRVRFYSASTKKIIAETPFSYNTITRKLEFTMPNDKLLPDAIYRMEVGLINPASNAGSNKTLSEGITQNIELLNIYFRVSKYNTFYEKMKSPSATFSVTNPVGLENSYLYQLDLNTNEGFDDYEIGQISGQAPLIIIEDEFKNSSWYKNFALPSIYNYSGYEDNKPKLLPGDQILLLSYKNNSTLPIKKEDYERNILNITIGSAIIDYNKYNKVFSHGEVIYNKMQNSYQNALQECDKNGTVCDPIDPQIPCTTPDDCKAGYMEPQRLTFIAPPASTKLIFNYTLPIGGFNEEEPYGNPAALNGSANGVTGRKTENTLPAAAVSNSLKPTSIVEHTFNH